ncbi:MAG: YkuS family protein [Syntrophomonadaceae bacterium]
MDLIIAVEGNLTPVKEFLAAQGCRVMDLSEARFNRVDAVVISGMDENLTGMQEVVVDAPVITARGRTPGEVWQEIQKK